MPTPAVLRKTCAVSSNRAPTPVRWLVVDAGAITNVDYSAARVVRALQDDLTRDGVVLVLVHAQSSLLADLDRHRLTDVIDTEHIFDSLHEALATIRENRVHAMEAGKSGAG